MPQVQILHIVVASPSDVQAERNALPTVVEELNNGIAQDRGLRLELTRWETDAYPGFHPEGPQGLINRILRIEECDILIGIFWKRFGTPVKDAKSGTEHEFRRGYEAWKRTGRPQIMVYFNQQPYAPKTREETDQWGQVLDFQRNFPKEGLWWPYQGRAQFERLVRTHLTQFLRQQGPVASPEPHKPSEPVPLPKEGPEPAPLGAIVVAIVGITLLVFLASWVGLLSHLYLNESLEQLLVHLGNSLAPPPWSESIIVIGVDPEPKTELGVTKTKPSDLRLSHAQILPRLAKAGARVILLDYYYEVPSGYDADFAQSIREARKQGSEVIVGANRTLTLVPELKEAVSAWGVGENVLGTVLGCIRKMRLVEVRDKNAPIPFLGLQAIYYGLRGKDLRLNNEETLLTLYNQQQKEIPILQMTDFNGRPLFFPSTKGRWAEIYIRFSPLKTLEDWTVSYHSLLDAAEDSPLWQRFQGKLVLIGNTVTPDDKHSISPTEKRSGVYILADGINTLLQGRYIQHAQIFYHIIILLVVSSMGAWLRWRIPPRRTALGKWLLVGLSLLYLAAAISLYTEFLILVKITYHLVALVLTYWSVGLLRKSFA